MTLKYEIPNSLIAEIKNIEKKYNVIVEKTTTTGASGVLSGAYNNRNDNEESEEFFDRACELYELVYIRHIGSGIFYDYAYYTESMQQYVDEAMPIIENYIENNLYEDICNSYTEE